MIALLVYFDSIVDRHSRGRKGRWQSDGMTAMPYDQQVSPSLLRNVSNEMMFLTLYLVGASGCVSGRLSRREGGPGEAPTRSGPSGISASYTEDTFAAVFLWDDSTYILVDGSLSALLLSSSLSFFRQLIVTNHCFATMDKSLNLLSSLWAQVCRDTYWVKAAALIALPAAGYLAARFIEEYQGWLRMGRGGLPYNLYGYFLNLYLTFRFGHRDTMSLARYGRPDRYSPLWSKATKEEKINAQKSWLPTTLSVRPGPRSRAIHYCAPQRERNAHEYIDPELKQVNVE